MAKKILADQDFSQGIRTRNIKVPKMPATVALENPELFKDYDDKKEQLILQKLMVEAREGLNEAAKEIKDAIEDFDERFGKDLPTSEKEAKERIATFEAMCRKIAKAQESKVEKRVDDEWEMHKKRDAALTRMNLKFAADITLATLSLAASVAIASLSMGTLAVTLLGAAKTVVTTALEIKEFASGRDKAAEEVEDIDATLAKIYTGPKMKGIAFKTAKEVAVAAGMPFMDSVGKFEKKIEEFLGKSARVDDKAQKLYEQANKLMAEIKKVDEKEVGPANAKLVDQMGRKTTDLLNEIGNLRKSVDADNGFYKDKVARCKLYEAINGKALGSAVKGIEFAKQAAEVASLAKDIVDIALKLA